MKKSNGSTFGYPPAWVGGLVLACVYLIVKLPFVTHNAPINMDESQMLAQAITLNHDPVFWRSVDGTTSGPLNTYLIWLAGHLGFPYTYQLLHGLAVALMLVYLGTTYRLLLRLVGPRAALISTLLLYCFLLLTNHWDFNHYNSELLSVVLLSLGLYLLACIQTSPYPSLWLFGLLGVVSCLVPLAKLQGGPVALGYLVYAGADLLFRPLPLKRKAALGGAMAVGSKVVLGLLLAFLGYFQVLEDAYLMYIVTNLAHYNAIDPVRHFVLFVFRSSSDYFYLVLVSASLGLISVISRGLNRLRLVAPGRFTYFLLANLLISFWVATRTGYNFPHYLFYTFLPLALLNAYAIRQLLRAERARFRLSVAAQLVVIGLGFMGMSGYSARLPDQHFAFPSVAPREVTVASLIKRYAKPTDALAVWGWNCWYYTETGLWQAVRQNHSIRCMKTISTGALQNDSLIAWYRRQYVSDLERNRPAFFVDEVRDNIIFTDPEHIGYQSVPALKSFIDKHYQLVQEVEGIFVFVRNDRL
jgi:hypothetical protein